MGSISIVASLALVLFVAASVVAQSPAGAGVGSASLA